MLVPTREGRAGGKHFSTLTKHARRQCVKVPRLAAGYRKGVISVRRQAGYGELKFTSGNGSKKVWG